MQNVIFFHYVHIFQYGKCTYIISIISFWRLPLLFLFRILMISCKTTFKDFYKISLRKNVVPWAPRAMGARCILVNGGPIGPSFEKNQRLNQIFNMPLSKTQPKIKVDHTFAQVWCSCSKLCHFLGNVSFWRQHIITCEHAHAKQFQSTW